MKQVFLESVQKEESLVTPRAQLCDTHGGGGRVGQMDYGDSVSSVVLAEVFFCLPCMEVYSSPPSFRDTR